MILFSKYFILFFNIKKNVSLYVCVTNGLPTIEDLLPHIDNTIKICIFIQYELYHYQ